MDYYDNSNGYGQNNGYGQEQYIQPMMQPDPYQQSQFNGYSAQSVGFTQPVYENVV